MIHRVKIEKIITGGAGLARLENGLVVMTRYVIPGETVLVRETVQHRGYLEAQLVDVIDASPDRVSPPCPYFTDCGGCDFQHMEISCQHHVKTEIIRESLQRANVTVTAVDFQALLPSPQSYQYRFRVRLQVRPDGQIGFYQTGSNDLVPITRCLLAADSINQVIHELNFSNILQKLAVNIREIELHQSPSDNLVSAVLHLRQDSKNEASQLDTFAASCIAINSILIKKGKKLHQLRKKASPFILSQDFDSSVCNHPFTLSWSSGCFSQINAQQNKQLIAHVCGQFQEAERLKILDLYCGMGNFSVPVGLTGADITGVEQNPESIRWAEFNAQQSGLTRYRFLASDVTQYLQALQTSPTRFDTVLLDPPRQGLGRQTRFLARLEPKKILYISCDPATLARDLAMLTNSGYRLAGLTPVDMFPQTHHIESVALLEKN